jgi:hypothetical protein
MSNTYIETSNVPFTLPYHKLNKNTVCDQEQRL